MKRTLAWLLLCCVLVTVCVACGREESPEESDRPSVTTHTTKNFLDIRIQDLLTKEQIEKTLDRTMREPEVLMSGTQLFALSEDGTCSVKLNMQAQEYTRFSQNIAAFTDAEVAPNLGEAAWWVKGQRTLFVYAKGYALNVNIRCTDIGEEGALLLSRELIAAVLEKL